MPDAADRAALRTLQKRGLVPLPQFQQGGLAEVMPFVEIRQGAAPGKLVPRANKLAIVTAINAIADQWPQVGVNAARMLNRQVGNAAPGIEPVRGHNGLRRAGSNAGGALSAVSGPRRRLCQGKRHIGKNLAQKER